MCVSFKFGLTYILNTNLKRVNIKNNAKFVYLHEVRFTLKNSFHYSVHNVTKITIKSSIFTKIINIHDHANKLIYI